MLYLTAGVINFLYSEDAEAPVGRKEKRRKALESLSQVWSRHSTISSSSTSPTTKTLDMWWKQTCCNIS
ncbi:hypothetical protein Bca52824_034298 [Brassica carinata]|uniref:Uncharacterized protein n=1 Tax=Brassica carinata TaxID=52824 RepID=A0A8X7V1M8_BRACI|nr:hypothetical protein Bca52824_034298 [Brassica carinata]